MFPKHVHDDVIDIKRHDTAGRARARLVPSATVEPLAYRTRPRQIHFAGRSLISGDRGPVKRPGVVCLTFVFKHNKPYANAFQRDPKSNPKTLYVYFLYSMFLFFYICHYSVMRT